MKQARRFPWVPLLLAWAAASIVLTLLFRNVSAVGPFSDADDQLRLLQVRDLMDGQSWFDLTQYRIHPPEGLTMHWSRLVDIPILVFLVPLTPIIGARAAEAIAVQGAPLLTLLFVMAALAVAMRQLHPRRSELLLLACGFAIIAPSILTQIHPARIDHHGWQIAFATACFAALLGSHPQRSGLLAGLWAALLLAVSIEGAPFLVAALGGVAFLWVFARESGVRLAMFAQSLAVCSLIINPLVAPLARWTAVQCDAVMGAHLAAFATGALALTFAVRLADERGWATRAAAILFAGLAAIAPLAIFAPDCLGSPFGTLNPAVARIWLGNIAEALPFWEQTPSEAATIIAFPIIALAGTIARLRHVTTPEARRRWLLVLILLLATLVAGALVRRASGTAHIIAIPGVVVILCAALDWIATSPIVVRTLLRATAIFCLSPLGAVYISAQLWPGQKGAVNRVWAPSASYGCGTDCAIDLLNTVAPTSLFAEFSLGPVIVARTHHTVYAAGYHRLQEPLASTIQVFTGSSVNARSFLCLHDLRFVLIEPNSGEVALYRGESPNGFAALLAQGKPPSWLQPIDFGAGTALSLYRVNGCRGGPA